MVLHIVVTAKQVLDPETPLSAFHIDPEAKRVVPPQNVSPVVNGFDGQAGDWRKVLPAFVDQLGEMVQ